MLPSAHQLAPPLPTVPRYKLVICRGDTSADLTAAAQVTCSALRAAYEDLVALEAIAVVDHLQMEDAMIMILQLAPVLKDLVLIVVLVLVVNMCLAQNVLNVTNTNGKMTLVI